MWCQAKPLCQMFHNHCSNKSVLFALKTILIGRCNQRYWNRRFAIPGVWANAGAPWKTGFSHQVMSQGHSKWSSLGEKFWARSWRRGRSKWSSLVEKLWARSWCHLMGICVPAFAQTPGMANFIGSLTHFDCEVLPFSLTCGYSLSKMSKRAIL